MPRLALRRSYIKQLLASEASTSAMNIFGIKLVTVAETTIEEKQLLLLLTNAWHSAVHWNI